MATHECCPGVVLYEVFVCLFVSFFHFNPLSTGVAPCKLHLSVYASNLISAYLYFYAVISCSEASE